MIVVEGVGEVGGGLRSGWVFGVVGGTRCCIDWTKWSKTFC